jgi:hypothetical protein
MESAPAVNTPLTCSFTATINTDLVGNCGKISMSCVFIWVWSLGNYQLAVDLAACLDHIDHTGQYD